MLTVLQSEMLVFSGRLFFGLPNKRRSKNVFFRSGLVCLLSAFFLLLSPQTSALALDVVIVKSKDSPFYDQISRQISRSFERRAKLLSIPGKKMFSIETRTIVQGDLKIEAIEFGNADISFSVGKRAYQELLKAGIRPLVHVYAQQPNKASNGVAGISMVSAPAAWFEATQRLEPRPKRIGCLVTENWNNRWIQEARKLLEVNGSTLLVKTAESPKDVPKLLNELHGKIDALWVPPVPSLLSRDSLEAILAFSLEARVPVVSYSPRLLKAGVAVSVAPDLNALSNQAVELGIKMLEMDGNGPVSTEYPSKYLIEFNSRVLENLGLQIGNGDLE